MLVTGAAAGIIGFSRPVAGAAILSSLVATGLLGVLGVLRLFGVSK